MQKDFITEKLFGPFAGFLYDWTGIHMQPFTLLIITVIVLTVGVIYIMKNS